MAYNGYLVKVISGSQGDFEISTKMIKADSYSVTWNGQDFDSYRDANGLLHRNALPHPCIKVEFEVKPMLTNEDVSAFMGAIRSRMINVTEKKVLISAYNPETDDYISAECYIPDIQFPIYGTYGGKLHYDAFRVAFIQY